LDSIPEKTAIAIAKQRFGFVTTPIHLPNVYSTLVPRTFIVPTTFVESIATTLFYAVTTTVSICSIFSLNPL
jgi:hypothetical protein